MNPRLLLLLAALSLLSPAHAQPACPWLTEGTAAAALDAPVTITTNLLPSGDGTCTFTTQQTPTPSRLEITVATSAPQACPPSSKHLPGIGNEALTCTLPGPSSETTDLITARVRNRYFTLRLTLPTASSPTARQSLAEQIAEQVAGNLY